MGLYHNSEKINMRLINDQSRTKILNTVTVYVNDTSITI